MRNTRDEVYNIRYKMYDSQNDAQSYGIDLCINCDIRKTETFSIQNHNKKGNSGLNIYALVLSSPFISSLSIRA
jgi:hypothetical protein